MSGKKFMQRLGNCCRQHSVLYSGEVQELTNVLGKCAMQVSVPVVENHSDESRKHFPYLEHFATSPVNI